MILLAAFLVHGFACNLTMTAFTLSLAPATPILTWSLREFFRQKDAADALEELMKKVQRAWSDALAAKASLDDCLLRSLEFQSAIFARRSSAPSVLPLVYRFKRFGLEDER